MSDLQASDFPAFFEVIYGYEPFPWQRMLVEHVAENGWPEGIDLPTASGKTACIDAAVFLLALFEQDGRLPVKLDDGRSNPARRRIFFVVDRRIVVDEAHRRAQTLADKLADPDADDMIKKVANRLRRLAWGNDDNDLIPAGERIPLIASRLRGGTVKDERWRLSPVQPAIITSTVDQFGSRLLFRSYGSSSLSAPIEAALTACDSLILLDEAHCAVPFMQTARAVQRYAGEKWMEEDPFVSPLTFSILSATLPEDVEKQNIFPKREERDAALDHPLLQKRISASKPAELTAVADTGDRDAKLIAEAVKQAQQFVKNGRCRIAIMVNRVARASGIESELRKLTNGDKPRLDADVVVMTGRMRPIDRDEQVEKWSRYLKAGSHEQPEKSIILVTTQCLEVGADFSFDALITECASLDALRQRFGRLNRLGEFENTDAAVLVRRADLGATAEDPIYGTALRETWNWLNQAEQLDGHERFNFGISAVDALLPDDPDERGELTAPSPAGPVMLPAHVDLLCQTAPQPRPDPDVAVFLHGPQRHVPEVRVVFRADLGETIEEDWQTKWTDAVSLLPPLTAEALTLPLWLIRKWLALRETPQAGDLSDIESQQSDEATTDATSGQPFVIWRGRRDSTVSRNPQDVNPNQTIVVPAVEALATELGHAFCRPEGTPLDVAERAHPKGREQHVLRLLPAVYQQQGMPTKLADIEPLKSLFEWAKDDDREIDELNALLNDLTEYPGDDESGIPAPPPWLRDAAKALKERRRPVEPHPAGGVVLLGKAEKMDAALDLDFGDMDDAVSAIGQPVGLSEHLEHVKTRAETWAQRCLPDMLARPLTTAAELHDLGKADSRWQQVQMHAGKEDLAAIALSHQPPLLFAKSNQPSLRGSAFSRACEHAGMPRCFRHEMLSMQLADARRDLLPKDDDLHELILHLIASHHGHGRPFAPVCVDEDPPDVEVADFKLTSEQRRNSECVIPAHRLDSGVAARFWKLTRRYGWWGLAYLEAILRLADHAASAAESSPKQQEASR